MRSKCCASSPTRASTCARPARRSTAFATIKCDGQIGLEESPDEWVARLVEVFREVRRVLRDDGTLWVEIGDSYSVASRRLTSATGTQDRRGSPRRSARAGVIRGAGRGRDTSPKTSSASPGSSPSPSARTAGTCAPRSSGRGPNPMPESVTDRPTKAHSTVFLLSKTPRYFYDQEAMREAYSEASAVAQRTTAHYNTADRYGAGNGGNSGLDSLAARMRRQANSGRGVDSSDMSGDVSESVTPEMPRPETLGDLPPEAPRGPDGRRATAVKGGDNSEQHRDGERWPASGANARSVWTIPTEPTPFAHFATWPQKLVSRMILAGTSERGVCPECGGPWVREVEITGGTTGKSWHSHTADGEVGQRVEVGPGNLRFKDYKRESSAGVPPATTVPSLYPPHAWTCSQAPARPSSSRASSAGGLSGSS